MDKLSPCLKNGGEPLHDAAAAEAAVLEKAKQARVMMHTAISCGAVVNAFALPMLQYLNQRCTSGLLGWIPMQIISAWFTDCEVMSSHVLHMIMRVFNLLLVLLLTTVWDPTNEVRGNAHKFFGCRSCRDKMSLPLQGEMKEKLLDGPRSDAHFDDEENAGASAAGPPPAVESGAPRQQLNDDDSRAAAVGVSQYQQHGLRALDTAPALAAPSASPSFAAPLPSALTTSSQEQATEAPPQRDTRASGSAAAAAAAANAQSHHRMPPEPEPVWVPPEPPRQVPPSQESQSMSELRHKLVNEREDANMSYEDVRAPPAMPMPAPLSLPGPGDRLVPAHRHAPRCDAVSAPSQPPPSLAPRHASTHAPSCHLAEPGHVAVAPQHAPRYDSVPASSQQTSSLARRRGLPPGPPAPVQQCAYPSPHSTTAAGHDRHDTVKAMDKEIQALRLQIAQEHLRIARQERVEMAPRPAAFVRPARPELHRPRTPFDHGKSKLFPKTSSELAQFKGGNTLWRADPVTGTDEGTIPWSVLSPGIQLERPTTSPTARSPTAWSPDDRSPNDRSPPQPRHSRSPPPPVATRSPPPVAQDSLASLQSPAMPGSSSWLPGSSSPLPAPFVQHARSESLRPRTPFDEGALKTLPKTSSELAHLGGTTLWRPGPDSGTDEGTIPWSVLSPGAPAAQRRRQPGGAQIGYRTSIDA